MAQLQTFINQYRVYNDFDLNRIQPQKQQSDLLPLMDPTLPNHTLLYSLTTNENELIPRLEMNRPLYHTNSTTINKNAKLALSYLRSPSILSKKLILKPGAVGTVGLEWSARPTASTPNWRNFLDKAIRVLRA